MLEGIVEVQQFTIVKVWLETSHSDKEERPEIILKQLAGGWSRIINSMGKIILRYPFEVIMSLLLKLKVYDVFWFISVLLAEIITELIAPGVGI